MTADDGRRDGRLGRLLLAFGLALGAAALFALAGSPRPRVAGWRPASAPEAAPRGQRAREAAITASRVGSAATPRSGDPAGALELPPREADPDPLLPLPEAAPPLGAADELGASTLPPARGRVVEAGTGRPIAGAWVTWRAVPPELADRVLEDPAFSEVGEGLITDAEGEFELARLPEDLDPAWTLHAVAPGHAPGTAPARLRGEARIELSPAGALRLSVRGLDEHALQVVGPGGRLTSAPGQGEWRLRRLAPGEWTVWVDGAAVGRAAVHAGRDTRLELQAPGRVAVLGRLVGSCPPDTNVRLVFSREGFRRSGELREDGSFSLMLAPGTWQATWEGDRLRLPLGAVEVRPGAPELTLVAPPCLPLELALGPEESFAYLHALDGPGRVYCGRRPGSSALGGLAPAGRYLVTLGNGDAAGVVSLPHPAPLTLQPRPFALELRWRASCLRPGERLFVKYSLSWVGPDSSRSIFTIEVPAEEASQLELRAPGTYLLRVESDLGELRRELTLAGPTTLEVDLGAE